MCPVPFPHDNGLPKGMFFIEGVTLQQWVSAVSVREREMLVGESMKYIRPVVMTLENSLEVTVTYVPVFYPNLTSELAQRVRFAPG